MGLKSIEKDIFTKYGIHQKPGFSYLGFLLELKTPGVCKVNPYQFCFNCYSKWTVELDFVKVKNTCVHI